MKRWSPSLALLLALGAACSSDDGTASTSVAPFANTPGGAQNPDGSGATTPGATTPGANDGSGTSNANGSTTGGSANNGDTETGPGGLPLGMTPDETGNGSSVSSQSLPRSTPEAQGLSSDSVLALVNALDAGVHDIHSMVLLRHGQVVAEGFWAPYRSQDIQVLYSATKSFNATAIGLLVQEGQLSVDDLVISKFPELAPAQPDANLAAMRIRDLLTMSTGHAGDVMDMLRAAPNGEWTRRFFELPVQNAPGSRWFYNSGAAYMLAAIVQRVSGMSVEEYLTPRLFEPLGIQQRLWGKSPEGVNMGDGGLSVRTEDLAKFGLLYVQGGLYDGQRLLAEQWVADAGSSQISGSAYGYGYQFWRSPQGYRADGSLGQFAYVLPDQDLVLAITSAVSQGAGEKNVTDTVFANLPAVQAEALPENTGAQQALLDKLSSLSLALPTGAATSSLASQLSGARYTAAPNNQGITALTFDFASATPSVTIEDADGPHQIPVGSGQWVHGRTGFKKRINDLFDTPDQGIAAQGAWSADDTFTARMVFTETPYTAVTSFKFDGNRVLLDVGYNVRWGAASEPQVSATR